jgi:uncharacterized membrane protein YeaQ/YmgE (transglycosylase-associated protein family)
MNSSTQTAPRALRSFVLLLVLFRALIMPCAPLLASDDQSIGQKAENVAHDTTAAVEKAGTTVADTAQDLWHRIDASRLKNRTPDELVAWVIMGILVGAVAGIMTPFKPTGSGRFARLVFGLVGAFLGGIAANVFNVNFGWGPVLIRYEELAFSFGGAIVILVIGKLIGSRVSKKGSA